MPPSATMALKTLGQHPAVHRVPPELWCEIFRCTADEKLVWDSLDPQNPLRVIDNVSNTWRTIIRSLPDLWSTILLYDCWTIPEGTDEEFLACISTRLRMISNLLSHSRNLPLTIVIGTPYKWDTAPLLQPTMQILTQHCHRWSSFGVRDPEDYDNVVGRNLTYALWLLEVNTLPSLQEMALELNRDGVRADVEYLKLDCDLPKLCKIHCITDCPPPDSLPFGQLTVVNFDQVDFRRCRQILPHLQSAVEITMFSWLWGLDWVESRSSIDDHGFEPFMLPALEKFRVEMWDDHCLSLMTAPNLMELEIKTLAGKYLSSITELISRSACTLTKLLCHDLRSARPYAAGNIDSDLLSVLSSSPNLQVLLLKVDERNLDTLLELLCERKNGRTAYCSDLQGLTIRCNAFITCPPLLSKLLDVFEARLSHSEARLRKVGGLPLWDDSFSEGYRAIYSRLDDMKREGLRVSYMKYKSKK